jgi:hypothetical protein
VRRVREQQYNPDPRQTRRGIFSGVEGIEVEAIVTTAITAATVSGGVITYGVGAAQIVIDHLVSGVAKSMNDPDYPNPVQVLSVSTTTGGVPVNTNVGLFYRNGRWGLAFVDCGN